MIAEAAQLVTLDPRPCEHCGLLLNDHFTVEGPEGPEHFCQPLDVAIHLRALRLQESWERSDPRDAWMHTGEAPPPASVRNGSGAPPARQSKRPAQSTIDAFLYLVSLKDPDRLVAWLKDRERDRPFLLKLLEAK
jgi:hypothetical protein